MFDAKDMECLNPEYFSIIMANEYDVTVMSRNTGHYWYVHCTGVVEFAVAVRAVFAE